VAVSLKIALHESVRIFVNSIVGKVHKHISKIALARFNILVSCESGKSLFVDKHPEWIDAEDENVDAKVKFESVNQVWFVEVALSNTSLSGL